LYRDFLVRNPDLVLIPFRPISLPPALFPAARSRLFFALLGDAGPDHIVSDPEEYQLLFEQGFLYPLDEYIFDVLRDKSGQPVDPDGRAIAPTKSELFYRDRSTGKYSLSVPIARRLSVCSKWEELPPPLRAPSVRHGKVYGIPVPDGFTCLIYRRDLFARAGLDPDSPLPDWDAFLYCAQKLTEPDRPIRRAPVQKGQYGFACAIDPALEWLNYLWQAGGDPLRETRFCPEGHRIEAKNDEHPPSKCPLCGKSLRPDRPSWSPAFASDAGVVASRYYRTLRTLRWTRCPRCGEPVNIPAGSEKLPLLACPATACQHVFPFPSPDRIYRGVVREIAPDQTEDRTTISADLFERGEVAMLMVTNPYRFVAGLSLPAETIGMMPLPRGRQWVTCPLCHTPIILTPSMTDSGRAVCPRDSTSVDLLRSELHGGVSANLVNVTMWGINSSSPRASRNAAWRLIEHRMSDRAKVVAAQSLVDDGYARAAPPSHLLLAEYGQLYQSLPKTWALVEQQSLSSARLPPFVPGWSAFTSTAIRDLLKDLCRGDETRLSARLQEAAATCAAAIRSEAPAVTRQRQKGIPGILIPLAILVLLALRRLYRAVAHRRSAPRASIPPPRKRGALAWLLLAPALACLTLWVYIPLLRSIGMSFYDWPPVGEKRFLGLLNFAAIFASPDFWRILLQSVVFVGLSIILGFAGPILLALLLSEVPRGRLLFRAIFYLPALTSGLAVALLWRLMYDPTEKGFLNWLLLHMPRSVHLILPFLLMIAFAGLSAVFFRRREFIPGVLLLILSFGLIVLIPRIEPLRRPINWLANPAAGGIWTMLCVILPAVWASAGPGSMIYLAALRNIPAELYESAELDGAGVFARIRHITLAELKPLVVVNLLGALVGTSQAIRNIFVLTGGGPAGKTRVLPLDIWYNAFAYLRFGYATALTWILASMVVGLAVCQLRQLWRAQFRHLPVET
jgi:ABC-type sugar transport system permease subunit